MTDEPGSGTSSLPTDAASAKTTEGPAEAPKAGGGRERSYGNMALRYPLFLPWAWFLLPDEQKKPPPETPLDVTPAPRDATETPHPPPDPTERPTPPPAPAAETHTQPEAEPEPPPKAAPQAFETIDAPATPDLVALDNLIKDYVILSMAIGLVPVPAVDIAAMIGVQVKMAHALSRRYGLPFSQHRAQTIATSLASGLLPVMTGVGVASLFKIVPGVGSLVGGATCSVVSGGLTYATGRLLIQHFESGGTLLTFDPEQMAPQFRREFRNGKRIARRLRAQTKTSRPCPPTL